MGGLGRLRRYRASHRKDRKARLRHEGCRHAAAKGRRPDRPGRRVLLVRGPRGAASGDFPLSSALSSPCRVPRHVPAPRPPGRCTATPTTSCARSPERPPPAAWSAASRSSTSRVHASEFRRQTRIYTRRTVGREQVVPAVTRGRGAKKARRGDAARKRRDSGTRRGWRRRGGRRP